MTETSYKKLKLTHTITSSSSSSSFSPPSSTTISSSSSSLSSSSLSSLPFCEILNHVTVPEIHAKRIIDNQSFIHSAEFYKKNNKHYILENPDININEIHSYIQFNSIVIPTITKTSKRILHFCLFVDQKYYKNMKDNDLCPPLAYVLGLIENIISYDESKRNDYIFVVFIDDSIEYFFGKEVYDAIVKFIKDHNYIHLVEISIPILRINPLPGHIGLSAQFFRYLFFIDDNIYKNCDMVATGELDMIYNFLDRTPDDILIHGKRITLTLDYEKKLYKKEINAETATKLSNKFTNKFNADVTPFESVLMKPCNNFQSFVDRCMLPFYNEKLHNHDIIHKSPLGFCRHLQDAKTVDGTSGTYPFSMYGGSFAMAKDVLRHLQKYMNYYVISFFTYFNTSLKKQYELLSMISYFVSVDRFFPVPFYMYHADELFLSFLYQHLKYKKIIIEGKEEETKKANTFDVLGHQIISETRSSSADDEENPDSEKIEKIENINYKDAKTKIIETLIKLNSTKTKRK